MPPLIIEEEMDVMSSGNWSDAEPISTDMLGDIHGSSQSRLSVNRRYERCKIRDRIK